MRRHDARLYTDQQQAQQDFEQRKAEHAETAGSINSAHAPDPSQASRTSEPQPNGGKGLAKQVSRQKCLDTLRLHVLGVKATASGLIKLPLLWCEVIGALKNLNTSFSQATRIVSMNKQAFCWGQTVAQQMFNLASAWQGTSHLK